MNVHEQLFKKQSWKCKYYAYNLEHLFIWTPSVSAEKTNNRSSIMNVNCLYNWIQMLSVN
jgi:hypothetical protein